MRKINKVSRRKSQARKKQQQLGGKPSPVITGGPQAQEAVVVETPPPARALNPEVEALRATSIGELMTFSTRALNGLVENGVTTIGDLLDKTRGSLKAIPGITDLVIEQMRVALYERGLDNESAHLVARPTGPTRRTRERSRRPAA